MVAVAVIGVLIRQQAHVLADGAVAVALPQGHAHAFRASVVVVEVVLQREVLHVEVRAHIAQRGVGLDAFHRRRVPDDHPVAALADERDVVARDGGQHGIAQVVETIRKEYVRARGIGTAVLCTDEVQGAEQAARIAGLHLIPLAVLRVGHLTQVHDGQLVQIRRAIEVESQCACPTRVFQHFRLSVAVGLVAVEGAHHVPLAVGQRDGIAL